MFGQKAPARPPKRAFAHDPSCRTPDADVQWQDYGDQTFKRICSCGGEVWRPTEPARPPATLSPSNHRHSTLADNRTPCEATAQVVFEDGGWKSWCPLCQTVCYGPEWGVTPGVSRTAQKELDQRGAWVDAELLAERNGGRPRSAAAFAPASGAGAVGGRVMFASTGLLELSATDTARRTITGMLVEWGTVAASKGRRWRFAPNSLYWSQASRVKLNLGHERSETVGAATALWESPRGLHGSFKVAKVPEGDRALELAASGVWDGLSIEVGFAEDGSDDYGPDPADPAVTLVRRGGLMGVALTPNPAFDEARVERVAAARRGGW